MQEVDDTKLLVWIGGSAIKRGVLCKLCCLSVTSELCKGAHKYYMKENVEFSRCIYVLSFAVEDVITYIESTITYSGDLEIPVFQLKYLTDQHKKNMIFHGAATKNTKYVHATLFKNQVLENNFCLCQN